MFSGRIIKLLSIMFVSVLLFSNTQQNKQGQNIEAKKEAQQEQPSKIQIFKNKIKAYLTAENSICGILFGFFIYCFIKDVKTEVKTQKDLWQNFAFNADRDVMQEDVYPILFDNEKFKEISGNSGIVVTKDNYQKHPYAFFGISDKVIKSSSKSQLENLVNKANRKICSIFHPDTIQNQENKETYIKMHKPNKIRCAQDLYGQIFRIVGNVKAML